MEFCLKVFILLTIGVLEIAGNTYHETICDGEVFNPTCSTGEVLAFDAANYGRTNDNLCGSSDVIGCQLKESVAILNKNCFGLNTCSLAITDVFSAKDPCPDVLKYLNATYSCVPESDVTESCRRYMVKLGSKPQGYIKSYNYPGLYNEKSDCVVKLTARPGFRYDLTLLDLDVQNRVGVGCYDWLIVKDEDNPAKHFNYCGKYPDIHTEEPAKSEQLEHVAVEFRSDPFADGNTGYLIKYQEVPELPSHREL